MIRAPYPSAEAVRWLPYMAWWSPKVDRHSMFQQLEQLRRGYRRLREKMTLKRIVSPLWIPLSGDVQHVRCIKTVHDRQEVSFGPPTKIKQRGFQTLLEKMIAF